MQSVNITNQRKEKLDAYLFETAQKPQYIMIICHGFRGAKENGGKICSFANKLVQKGIGVVAFDFSGSGNSEGDFWQITLSRQAEDLHTVIEYVHKEFAVPILLLGRSFGGSTILAGGSHDERVKGFILWSAPIKLEQTFAKNSPEEYQKMSDGYSVTRRDDAGEYILLPSFVHDFAKHDMDAYLTKIYDKPVLIVQARDDDTVDPENAVYMLDRLDKGTLFMADHAGHSFLNKISLRENLTIEWITSEFGL